MTEPNRKKAEQLGMSPGKAAHILVKDILFAQLEALDRNSCFRCGKPMRRADFSIEHIEPWLDSDNPSQRFFDLSNISFSHLMCNVGARRQTVRVQCGTTSGYRQGCRCEECTKAMRTYKRENYTSQARKNRYLRTGN